MDERQAVLQNLMDAGCDAALSDQFVSLVERGQERAALALLARHRKNLLKSYHAAEKKIDCLDYLVYQMEKKAQKSYGGI